MALTAKTITLTDIDFGERGRQSYSEIEELAETIRQKGLIQPITVMRHPDDDKANTTPYLLVAGGRRFRAHEHLEANTIDCVVREVKGDIDFAEIELMENLYRKELSWLEVCEMELALHEMRLKDDPGQTFSNTASEIDTSQTTLYRHIMMGKALRSVPELGKLKTFKEASKFLSKMQEEVVSAELAKRAETDKSMVADLIPDSPSALAEAASIGEELKGRDEIESHRLSIATKVYQIGDALDGMALTEPLMFDFAEVDPPYGIDLKNSKRKESESTPLAEYNEVDEKEYAEWLYNMYDEVYVKLKENAFAICWFGMTHFEVTRRAIKHAGFTVGDIPGIWVKPSGQTQQPKYNLANCYEPFFIARKGKAVLTREGRSNIFAYLPVAGQKKIHPTERPIELIQEILTTFCQPGATVLCPFLGSGTTIRAGNREAMQVIGWDLTEEYKNAYLLKICEDLDSEFAETAETAETTNIEEPTE